MQVSYRRRQTPYAPAAIVVMLAIGVLLTLVAGIGYALLFSPSAH